MKIWIASLSCLLLSLTPVVAKEVAGVNLEDKITLQNTQLSLNGAGIRTKFVFDIYVGALYLANPTSKVETILKGTTSNRLRMVFLYDEVSKEKLTDGWTDGFENNLEENELNKLKDKITAFNQLFETVKKGDIIDLDYISGKGTHVYYNSVLRGKIEGEDFNRALLKIWLGEDPADDELKAAMLGQKE